MVIAAIHLEMAAAGRDPHRIEDVWAFFNEKLAKLEERVVRDEMKRANEVRSLERRLQEVVRIGNWQE